MGKNISVVACALALVAACGSDDSTGDAGPAPSRPIATTAAPLTTAAPSTSVEPTTTVAPSTTAAPSTSVEPTTTATTTTTAGIPLPDSEPLTAGTTYRMGVETVGRAFEFTNQVGDSHAFVSTGFVGLTQDADGLVPLVSVADRAAATVFQDPLLDIDALPSPVEIDPVTVPAPDDYLAYVAGLPGVDADPIEEVTFAGLPARALTYRVGEVPAGHPCGGVDRGNCLCALWVPAGESGVVIVYWEGDGGTLYQFEVGDRTVIVDVADRPGAAETAASLRFV